jgi:KAP family P-loop domain/TIR domain
VNPASSWQDYDPLLLEVFTMPETAPVTPIAKDKPLVFLSASRHDEEWREGLRKRLSRYSDYFEWWDDSKLGTSEKWQEKIYAAMQRASVAVVFLSQAYLSSPPAVAELFDLGVRAAKGQLRLFPILLEPCEWKSFNFPKEVQIWNQAIPIGDFNAEAKSLELEKIAASIRALFVSSSRSTRDRTLDLKFSATANQVLARAWSLAERSNRGRITSSCLLFALAETGHTSTPQFIRTALDENGYYEREFERFLKDGGPSDRNHISLPGIPWGLTENAAETIRDATNIATRVTGSSVVHTRHLIAALITPEVTQSASIHDRLKKLGVEQAKLCVTLRKRVRSTARQDNPDQWNQILGISQASQSDPSQVLQQPVPDNDLPLFKRMYSKYLTDSVAFGKRDGEPLDDSLGVRTYASHLAQLIAAKDTPMPLAIGLFGAWGAGKSHFMDLLEAEINTVIANPGQTFHKKIVHIRFNAWHYLDTNLWANLVSEIFDRLFGELQSTGDEEKQKLENLKNRLAEQSALAAEAKAALTKAENVRRDAERELRRAMRKRIKEENKVSTLLNDLTNLPIGIEVQKQLHEVAQGLGLPKVETSFKELEARAEELQSLAGRTRALALAVFTGRGWWKRTILLAVALATPVLISLLAIKGPEWVQALLAGATRTVAQIVTVISAVSAWLASQLKTGNALVGKLESAYDEVTKVRTQREAKDDAAQAQVALALKQQEEEAARHKLAEAKEKLNTIRVELADMAPGRQLIRFLRQRASAEDYRRHLGLVSLVRKDFQELSNLLTGAQADPDNLPEINRIVLYIDDLDRCRADRVIEVLEAVQLLLAFPLFGVVVAVDPRWLRQSLLENYPRLLGAAEEARVNSRTSLGRAATPQDYLEKIFQVPFNLQPMDKPQFESLVNRFFSVDGSGSKDSEAPVEELAALRTAPPPFDERSVVVRGQIFPGTELLPPATLEVPVKEVIPSPPPRVDPERLVLTKDEIDDVQRFHMFFQTPRSVKRLANTYSLIRVGVDEKEWSDYLGFNNSSPGYRVPLLLLAVASAFPSLARPWLLWLRATRPAQWQIEDADLDALAKNHSDTTERVDWEKLQHCLDTDELKGWPPPDPESLNTWVPKVARYSF